MHHHYHHHYHNFLSTSVSHFIFSLLPIAVCTCEKSWQQGHKYDQCKSWQEPLQKPCHGIRPIQR